MGDRRCKDCVAEGVSTIRPAPYSGPRCATHHRERRKTLSARSHSQRVESTYGITGEEYNALLEFQGGVCAICRKARGVVKRLAVDHDHSLAGKESVRGLLCGRCNFDLIGKNDAESLQRAIDYLVDPPARRFFEMNVSLPTEE